MTEPSSLTGAGESKWPARIAWTFILLNVAFIIVAQYLPEIRGRKKLSGTSEMQVELLGKYTVGVKAFSPAAATQPAMIDSINKQFEGLDHSPQQTLRVAA